ncbi:TldD/PmbA family protein [Tanticharoenia sakaeratensis]|uniref:PmbA protein n=1 Tax=Tanticharoenia sakaeratensis NBRC 103193 TaxID=1231623 RepID=A0A0D6MJX8_9PROT|nr:PmbA protein [Tanticharoenia sakaeratensis NBRC 103193]GBQ25318.1 zinc-dependent microcin-processing U62/PmbA/TldD [Tanticharoenia sakaeratensis NBRC 103193]
MSLSTVEAILAAARRAGADQADALVVRDVSIGAMIRRGQTDAIEQAETTTLGLRVFVGQRSAIVSTTDLDTAGHDALAERAVAMARVVPEDRFGGLAEHASIGRFDAAGLDLEDRIGVPDTAALLDRAGCAEAAALSHAGISNSAGASAGYGRTSVALGTSAGFFGDYVRTNHSVSVSVLAGDAARMQRDYDYHSSVHLSDLMDAETIGHNAAERALARLDPRKPPTKQMPVVYDPRVSSSLLGHLLGAINGASVARGGSFLKNRLGEQIMATGARVMDDPLRVRGLRSRPFDGEGLRTAPLALIDDGVLTQWLLDSRSARQLGMTSNARAARGASSAPSPAPTNVYLEPGDVDFATLIGDIGEGVLLTEMMGSSVNSNTGDYSRGASGFMIRQGALAEPVAELTVAGNLIDMFRRITIGSDLEFRRGMDAPSIRIDGLSVAGQ